MIEDMREHLRRADALLREARYGEAISLYQAAGDAYAQRGIALKAVALFCHIVSLVDQWAPELSDARGRALLGLLHGYTRLGLHAEASRV